MRKVSQITKAPFFAAQGLRYHVAAETNPQVHGMDAVANLHQVHAAELVLTRNGIDGSQGVEGNTEVTSNGVPGANGDDAEGNWIVR